MIRRTTLKIADAIRSFFLPEPDDEPLCPLSRMTRMEVFRCRTVTRQAAKDFPPNDSARCFVGAHELREYQLGGVRSSPFHPLSPCITGGEFHDVAILHPPACSGRTRLETRLERHKTIVLMCAQNADDKNRSSAPRVH
jgi:hypothetical protein